MFFREILEEGQLRRVRPISVRAKNLEAFFLWGMKNLETLKNGCTKCSFFSSFQVFFTVSSLFFSEAKSFFFFSRFQEHSRSYGRKLVSLKGNPKVLYLKVLKMKLLLSFFSSFQGFFTVFCR